MADPGMQASRSPEILSGAPIPFRFELTWRSLTSALAPEAGASTQIPKPVQRTPTRDTEAKEWEMVLPRMKRPAAAAVEHARPSREQIPLSTPSFGTANDRGSRRWLFLACAALLLALAFATVRWTEQRSSSAGTVSPAMEMGSAGWMSEWASDLKGSARGRQISLYRPSIAMSDYRLEFLGRIDRKSLGWVFRAVDSANYYAGKLESSASGLVVTHFAVIRGVEGPHIQRPLPISAGAATTLRVKLEASGPRFTAYVQNQIVDDWEDDRLKTGGVGFLNEREERGQIESVQISILKGGRQ
jgi:hypothetical protein